MIEQMDIINTLFAQYLGLWLASKSQEDVEAYFDIQSCLLNTTSIDVVIEWVQEQEPSTYLDTFWEEIHAICFDRHISIEESNGLKVA